MADGGAGTKGSVRLGLCRSQPCNNGTSLGRESRLNAVTDRANLDSKAVLQGYQQALPANCDKRPRCSPSEYFCLKTGRSDALLNNRSDVAADTATNGYCSNDSRATATKTDDWHSCSSPTDKISESNLHAGGTSRRSGIPVSSMLLLFTSGI